MLILFCKFRIVDNCRELDDQKNIWVNVVIERVKGKLNFYICDYKIINKKL